MPEFIPGIELSRLFYCEAVRQILDEAYPGLPHAAARIGSGSDVLGFDTPMSMDHDRGPIVHIFLREEDAGLAQAIDEKLCRGLPHVFRGFPVDFEPAPEEPGTAIKRLKLGDPVLHRASVTTLHTFVLERLDYDLNQVLEAGDWLTIPAQKLREMTAGAVYSDGVGQAYKYTARKHNSVGITAEMPETATSFYGRPFRVIHAEFFAHAICQQITDPAVQRLAGKGLIDSIDQFSDSSDLRSEPGWREALKELFKDTTHIEKAVNRCLSILESRFTDRPSAITFFQKPPSLDPYIQSANQIDLCGVTLRSTVNKQFGNLRERLQTGAKIQILVIDPDPDALAIKMSAERSTFTDDTDYHRVRLDATLREFAYLFRSWEEFKTFQSNSAKAGTLSIRLLSYAPSFGIVSLDASQENGIVFVEIYAHKYGYKSPATFDLTPQRDGNWYKYFISQFDEMWNVAKRWQPPAHKEPVV